MLNACDFGDLLLHNLTIFTRHPDVLADYHERFRYILVDEYQDTNVAQYLWLRLLAQGRRNLCCVGDDDQSIYGWRGAEVDNILRFERDFPGREGDPAGAQLPLHRAHPGRRLRPDRRQQGPPGQDPVDRGAGRRRRCRCAACGTARPRRGWSPTRSSAGARSRRYREVAILVRASFQMRAFEERFVLLQIPYTVVGGPRFFERAEIRDAHAYLRLVQSEDDDLAFERIVNTPQRGIGDTTVQKLLTLARSQGVSARRGGARPGAHRRAAGAHPHRAGQLPARPGPLARPGRAPLPHPRLMETILEESGYTDALRLDKGPTSQTRLENLKELVQSMGAFDTLEAYLEHVSLVMDLDRGAGDDAVQIMTLHSAKGLEFPLVFLPGWEEGVFPSQRSMDEKGEKGLEEERRLAYVGITRAREEARISFAANRQVYGRWTSQLPSRFVDELPLANVEAASETGYYGGGPGMREAGSRWDETNFGSGYDSPGWKRAQSRGYAGGPPGPHPGDRGRGPAGRHLRPRPAQRLRAAATGCSTRSSATAR